MAETKSDQTTAGVEAVVIGQRYRVVRLLGSGGMGSVYEAENTWTGRRVAIKTMRAEVASSQIHLQRFMQEARAASQLRHPNIVDVLDMGEDPALGTLFIVQELLSGRDLRAHLEAVGRLAPSEALALLLPVLDALAVAHKAGVVHRDLKPDNIFLCDTPYGVVPKVIDFGIAKVVGEDGSSLQKTSTGLVMGTPYYMSPEQARGDNNLGSSADVWSMGVVLYQSLSGERPYSAPNPNLLLAKIIYEEPTPLALVCPELPASLIEAVNRALRKDPTQRYANMEEFAGALRRHETSAPAGRASPIPVMVPSPSLAPSTFSGLDLRVDPVAETTANAAERSWSRPVLVGLAGLATVALVGALASALRPGATPPPGHRSASSVARESSVAAASPPSTPPAATATIALPADGGSSAPIAAGVAARDAAVPSAPRPPVRVRPARRLEVRIGEATPVSRESPVNLLVPRRSTP